jgi:hypothetical protein
MPRRSSRWSGDAREGRRGAVAPVKTRVDERLHLEVARYEFRFACDDCAHFDVRGARCSMDYPAAPRRDALRGDAIELCKSFELE